jgi:DNA-binding GntR family transcriptional regulator
MTRANVIAPLDYIRDRILNFVFLPGVKISDDEIAKTLGMSRSPVREALNRLVEQGLVESRPNRGFVVKVYTRKEVADHYMLREALECLAVRMAIQSMDREKIKSIKDLLATYPSIMKSHDIARFNAIDERFHDLIALYSDNVALYEALRNLHGRIRIIRRYDHLRAGSFQETYEEHRLILKHMVRKDIRRAVKLMSYHILNSMKTVMRLLPNGSGKGLASSLESPS